MNTLHTIAFVLALCLAIHVIGSHTYRALQLIVNWIVDRLTQPPENR